MTQARGLPDRAALRAELGRLVRTDALLDKDAFPSKFPVLCGLVAVQSLCADGRPVGYAVEAFVHRAFDHANSDPLRYVAGFHAETRGLPYVTRRSKMIETYKLTDHVMKDWWDDRLLPLLVEAAMSLEVSAQFEGAGADPHSFLTARGEEVARKERLRLRRRGRQLPHLDLAAQVLVPSDDGREQEVDALLDEWVKSGSNIALLMGPVGSGKTATLLAAYTRLTTRSERTPIYARFPVVAASLSNADAGTILTALSDLFLPRGTGDATLENYFESHLDDYVVILDDFDTAGDSAGLQRGLPDLTDIAELITPNSKLLLASRRAPTLSDHLTAQLFEDHSRRAIEDFGARSPLVLHLEPADPIDIRQALERAKPTPPPPLVETFDRTLRASMTSLRRPLFVQMLLNIASEDRQHEPLRALSLVDLVERYVHHTLVRDWDRQLSHISERLKREVLRDIAWAVFVESQRFPTAEASLQGDQVDLRVLQAVTQGRSTNDIRLPPGHTFEHYNWAQDFRSTNHMVAPIPPTHAAGLTTPGRVRFEEPVVYDYFLAESILTRIAEGRGPGLRDDDPLGEHALSSLVLYFMKQRFTADLSHSISNLVREPAVSNLDRILMLYLLEDHDTVLEALRSAPPSYGPFLCELSQRLETVLARVVRYQIVLLEDSEERAGEFIEWARSQERSAHREPEGEFPSFTEPMEDFLLARLERPTLAATRAVTVWRLGQIGSAASLETLRKLRRRRGLSPFMRSIIDEALTAITSRNPRDLT